MYRHRNAEHEHLQLYQSTELPRLRCRYRQENTHTTHASTAGPTSCIFKFMQKGVIHCDIKP